jgi:squalene-hopene/tetraprenyl-beta-curcumene cyclase
MQRTAVGLAVLFTLAPPALLRADEPFTLKKYQAPSATRKDEPLAKQFSPAKAAQFLDAAALEWTDKRTCFSCHTNFAYLYARPFISAKAPAHEDVRKALETMVSVRWKEKGPRWPMEVVTAAAALAFNDAQTTGKLHPLTRMALDRMWTVQRKDGGFPWLLLGMPPMEMDEHYGVTLAALAVGFAPEDYAKTEAAQKGLAQLRAYLKSHPPQHLHHQAMLLWTATYLDGFQSNSEKQATIKNMLAQQRPDGGWNSAKLGNETWKRHSDEKSEQDFVTSDGYATGFTIYVLRRAGVTASDPAIQKGIDWIKSNQRESGRWFTRSLFKDDTHYLTHVGSAFAVMAIAECGALKNNSGAE